MTGGSRWCRYSSVSSTCSAMSITRSSGSLPPAVLELLLQGVAGDVLHHQVMAVLLAEAVEDARDMLVIELGEHVGFALKTGDSPGAACPDC